MNREMMDSDIKWIGHIPSTWKMIPNKYLFIEHCKKVGDNWKNYQLLSLTTKGIKEKDINSSCGKVPESYDNYQIVTPGDMIFCLFDLDVSAVFSGLSDLNGMITSAYNVCSVNNRLICESYANYWFQYVFSNRYYKIYSKNIRYTVTSDNFGLIKSPCPPINEQNCIGNYLDKKISQIDKLIANQEKQIQYLQNYKNAKIKEVINSHSVTSIRYKFLISVKSGNSLNPEDFIDFSNYKVYGGGSPLGFSKKFNCEKDSIIVGRVGANCGCVTLLDNSSWATDNALIVTKNNGINSKYLYYLMIASDFNQFNDSSAQPLITGTKIKSKKTPFDSDIAVQLETVKLLDKMCNSIDRLIQIKKEKIEKLNEYKKSLIYEYVTGKREVKEG